MTLNLAKKKFQKAQVGENLPLHSLIQVRFNSLNINYLLDNKICYYRMFQRDGTVMTERLIFFSLNFIL